MGSLAFFLIIIAAIVIFAFLSERKKSIKEGTWLGTPGMKAAYVWNHSASDKRDLMLAAIGILNGSYHDGLLSKEWTDLPCLVQTSLAETLAEIRKESTQTHTSEPLQMRVNLQAQKEASQTQREQPSAPAEHESNSDGDTLRPLSNISEPQAEIRQRNALSVIDALADTPTDPLTIQLRAQVENLDPLPGPKTVGSENYAQILDAFLKRGWTGFEEAFDRIVPRIRADYVKVKRDLLREPVFSLNAQRNMLRLANAFMTASTPGEKRAVVEQKLKEIRAERAALNPPVDVPECTNSAGHVQTGRPETGPSSAGTPESSIERLRKQSGSNKDWSEENLDAPNSSLTGQLSSQELERIANQLIAEGRMPSREQYMQVRQKVTARWRASKLVFGVIRGGAGIDTLVFIPEEQATELAAIHFAIARAKTWRQFAEMIPASVWSHLLRDLEDTDSTPDLDSTFDPGMIGVEDGDWPDWPEQKMMQWLPPEAVARYATVHQSVINGPFLSINPSRLAEVVEALESAGHTCYRNEALVGRACGRDEWSDVRDEEQVNAPECPRTETARTIEAPEQIASFTSIEEAGRHFQEAFARGDRRRRQFLIRDELWEVVNAGIPQLRRIIDVLVVSEISNAAAYEVRPLSEAGREWLQQHFPGAQIRFNHSVRVEDPELADLVTKIKRDRLILHQTVSPKAKRDERRAAEN